MENTQIDSAENIPAEAAAAEPVAETAPAAEDKAKTSGKGKWYIAQAHSGFEHKVAASIKEKAAQNALSDLIEEVYVPAEEVTQMKRGKKIVSERKFFPGYLMVKMQLTDATWHLVKSEPKVTGFLGGGKGGRPVPMTEREVAAIFSQVEEGTGSAKSTITFEYGESIKVCDGPFDGFIGTVEGVDDEKQRVKVSVAIFGRPTPVDLEFSQVEKVS